MSIAGKLVWAQSPLDDRILGVCRERQRERESQKEREREREFVSHWDMIMNNNPTPVRGRGI